MKTPFELAFDALLNCQASTNGGVRPMVTFGETNPQDIECQIEGQVTDPGLIPGAYSEDGETIIQAKKSDFVEKLRNGFQTAVRYAGRGYYVKTFTDSNGIYRITIADRTKKK